jgi:hypothetical protein
VEILFRIVQFFAVMAFAILVISCAIWAYMEPNSY